MGGGQGKGSQGAGGHVDAMPGQPLSPSGANHVSFPWPLPGLYLHFPSSRPGVLPTAPRHSVLLEGSGRTLSPLPNCCEQLSSGQPLASAEGPVLIKDNYIYSLAV